MPTVNNFINNLIELGYNQSDLPYSTHNLMVVWREDDFAPFNLKIKANGASLSIPYKYGSSFGPVEDNNPSISELDRDSNNNLITLNMNPLLETISCAGATNEFSIEWSYSNESFTVPLESEVRLFNGSADNPEGFGLEYLNTDQDVELPYDYKDNYRVTESFRFEFKLLPENQDQYSMKFSGDNPTIVQLGANHWGVCLSPAEQELPQISCDGATNTFHYELTLNSSWNSNYYIELTVNDEVFNVQVNLPDITVAWAILSNFINNQFGGRLQSNWVSGNIASITVLNNEQFRIKASIISDLSQIVGVLQFLENGLNPTVGNFTGDQNFIPYSTVCLAPAATEAFPNDPLMFHISSLDESSGWFQVEFWDVPIGSKLMIDWGDGSPIEEIISDSNNDGYLTPYHYYTSVDHVAKFAIDQPIGGWITQSANIDSVVSFGSAVQAGYIEIQKAYKLISVPAVLPEYINGISINSCNLLNDSNISLWDTSHITTMISMFRGCPLFNQPLNTWDVSKVTNMGAMFLGATAFNQDLSMWCVPLITSKPTNFASSSPLTPEHMPVWGTCPTNTP